MKDIVHPDVFLAISIKESSNGVKISLHNFITKIENDHQITKKKIAGLIESAKEKMEKLSLISSLPTPLVKGFNASETTTIELTADEHLMYRSIVGVLLFVANTFRLDISFATSLLSRYLVTPRIIHLTAA